jgi:signal transduction histidine kinase
LALTSPPIRQQSWRCARQQSWRLRKTAVLAAAQMLLAASALEDSPSVGEGAGLGLGLSWRVVVDKHHGDLRVESVPGNTRVQVRLPWPFA